MDTVSFIIYIKTNGVYKDIAEYDETRFDTSNYKFGRRLPNGKNSNWILSNWINERRIEWKNHDNIC